MVISNMRSIRLAVIFDMQIRVGGGYQQALTALLTRELPNSLVDVVYFTTRENIETLQTFGIKAELINLTIVAQLITHLRRLLSGSWLLKLVKYSNDIVQLSLF